MRSIWLIIPLAVLFLILIGCAAAQAPIARADPWPTPQWSQLTTRIQRSPPSGTYKVHARGGDFDCVLDEATVDTLHCHLDVAPHYTLFPLPIPSAPSTYNYEFAARDVISIRRTDKLASGAIVFAAGFSLGAGLNASRCTSDCTANAVASGLLIGTLLTIPLYRLPLVHHTLYRAKHP